VERGYFMTTPLAVPVMSSFPISIGRAEVFKVEPRLAEVFLEKKEFMVRESTLAS
jgi:hypothetical protein